MPGACQGSHWSANFKVTGMIYSGPKSMVKMGVEPRSAAVKADTLPLNQQGKGGREGDRFRERERVGTG